MSDNSIVTQLALLPDSLWPAKKAEKQGDLHHFWQHPEQLPSLVATCPTTRRYLELLGPLHWAQVPERNLDRNWGHPAIPFKALLIAELVKLNEGYLTFPKLWTFLDEHPAFRWVAGFPCVPTAHPPPSFNPPPQLPTQRHLARMLRHLPNAVCQFLLADSVQLILAELYALHVPPLNIVSLDTKHILAWVQENNPKAYVPNRYDKQRQPKGDPDCRLGCKKRRNQAPAAGSSSTTAARAQGEYHWGYGSGVVVAKVPPWGEFVIAELTQPFDQSDVTYFFPLMQLTQDRLGYKPRYGTFDAAFDAWYVYAYFYDENDPAGGFAAVPFSEKGSYKVTGRQFTADGLPLCAAHRAMPLQFTFTDRTSCLVPHERGKYVCPLRFPERTAPHCPAHDARWKQGGCTAMMPTSIGARLRYTLDRDSAAYKQIYNQRTACERINAQAVALGIERPHLRNGAAVANQNTLSYLLINLRFLQRLQQRQPEVA